MYIHNYKTKQLPLKNVRVDRLSITLFASPLYIYIHLFRTKIKMASFVFSPKYKNVLWIFLPMLKWTIIPLLLYKIIMVATPNSIYLHRMIIANRNRSYKMSTSFDKRMSALRTWNKNIRWKLDADAYCMYNTRLQQEDETRKSIWKKRTHFYTCTYEVRKSSSNLKINYTEARGNVIYLFF